MKVLRNKLKSRQQDNIIQQAQPQDVDVTLLANSLKASKEEADKLRRQLDETNKAREQAIKEREALQVRHEVSSLAKRLNVRDTAMDDVLSLVSNKFTIKDSKVIPLEKPDMEPEKYLGEWLSSKEHYVATPVAKSTGATPFPQNVPTQPPFDPSDPQALTAYLRRTGGFIG